MSSSRPSRRTNGLLYPLLRVVHALLQAASSCNRHLDFLQAQANLRQAQPFMSAGHVKLSLQLPALKNALLSPWSCHPGRS
eukprot:2732471-Pleurochrysis_carterae.AAC.2